MCAVRACFQTDARYPICKDGEAFGLDKRKGKEHKVWCDGVGKGKCITEAACDTGDTIHSNSLG